MLALRDLSSMLLEPFPDNLWLVQDVFARGKIIVLVGESAAGKSVFAYTLAYCVALGLPFLGFPTAQSPVVYFDEENSDHDLKGYNLWAWNAIGCPDPENTPLFNYFGLGAEWPSQMRAVLQKHHPGLVIIDTATPALSIKDENDNAEASAAIHNLKAVLRSIPEQPLILVIKHELDNRDSDGSHKGRRVVRGAKVWKSAVDQLVFFNRAGHPRADGTFLTCLTPDKYRYFGLRQKVTIDPELIGDPGPNQALVLRRQGATAAPKLPALASAQKRLTGRKAPEGDSTVGANPPKLL